MADAEALRQVMVEGLARRGELDPRWRAAFTEVPRHEFIPELVWRHDRDAGAPCDLVPVRRRDDPQLWLEGAYTNAPVNTQVDDGHPIGEAGRGREVTSSASMPAVVAQMLAALKVEPGMRVLEIGTGTGYNAALLAHRLGAERIVSVEVDPAVADHARQALATAGFGAVTVVSADGAEGYPPWAPYDRLISTAAVAEVPYAWVAQIRPGGLVLTPWGTPYYPGGLLALTVHPDATATGRIVGPASFMRLRAQRIPRYSTSRIVRDQDVAAVSTTDLHPWDVAGDVHAATAIGLRVPRCESLYSPDSSEAGRCTSWISGAAPGPPCTSAPSHPTRYGRAENASSGTRCTPPTVGGSTRPTGRGCLEIHRHYERAEGGASGRFLPRSGTVTRSERSYRFVALERCTPILIATVLTRRGAPALSNMCLSGIHPASSNQPIAATVARPTPAINANDQRLAAHVINAIAPPAPPSPWVVGVAELVGGVGV